MHGRLRRYPQGSILHAETQRFWPRFECFGRRTELFAQGGKRVTKTLRIEIGHSRCLERLPENSTDSARTPPIFAVKVGGFEKPARSDFNARGGKQRIVFHQAQRWASTPAARPDVSSTRGRSPPCVVASRSRDNSKRRKPRRGVWIVGGQVDSWARLGEALDRLKGPHRDAFIGADAVDLALDH